MRLPCCTLSVLSCCAILSTAALLHAEGTPPARISSSEEARRLAREHFQRAEIAYRQGNFKEALANYQETLRLRHHPNILFNIAQCYRQLKNVERALFYYKLFLSDWERVSPGSKPPNEAEVNGHVAALEAELRAAAAPASTRPPAGSGEILLKGVPAGAHVLVDGVLRGQGPVLAPVSVLPGKRLVRVELPGHEGWSQILEVPAAGKVSARVRLHRLVNWGVDSQPQGAVVVVNGKEYGWTPLRVTLPAGRAHALELRKDGYLPLTRSVRLEPRATAYASYELEPTRERFGTRDEWFAIEPALAIGVGGTEGLAGGGLALNIVTHKWKHVSWTIFTAGMGGGSGRLYAHMETRLGYPFRFGRRGQHQLRPGLGFGVFAIGLDDTTRANEEEEWLQRKDIGQESAGGNDIFVHLCLSPSAEYLYQSRGRTFVGGGLRLLVPITRSLAGGRAGAPTLMLFTVRLGWASAI